LTTPQVLQVTRALQGRKFRTQGVSSFPKTPHMIFRSITIPNHGPSMTSLRLGACNSKGRWVSLPPVPSHLPAFPAIGRKRDSAEELLAQVKVKGYCCGARHELGLMRISCLALRFYQGLRHRYTHRQATSPFFHRF
jgi:hypothetical protein